MASFLTRLTELAGADAAATLLAEFGGTAQVIPKLAQRALLPPFKVVLHASFSPKQPITQIATDLLLGLHALAGAGVQVTDMGIPARGMGGAYIAALQGPLGRCGVAVEAML